MLTASEVIFAVSDIRESVRYYREVLGFERDWFWGEPPTFAGALWGSVHVMFSLQPEMKDQTRGLQHSFRAEDVDGLYQRQKAAGAAIVIEIGNKPWGIREYTVEDLNGYRLRFGGPLKYERPPGAAETLPHYVQVEIRKVTVEEYVALTEAVGWPPNLETMPRALELSLFCVAATDTRDGRTVGMARVCGDGRYYTIWDVIVLPDYQGRKIGSAIMEAAMAELQQIGPEGSYVGLFTGKPEFYERFGFQPGAGMSRLL